MTAFLTIYWFSLLYVELGVSRLGNRINKVKLIIVIVHTGSVFYRKELILNDVESSLRPLGLFVFLINLWPICFNKTAIPLRILFILFFLPFEMTLQMHRLYLSGLLLMGNQDCAA